MSDPQPDDSSAQEFLVLEAFLPYRLSVLANRISSAIARDYQSRFGLRVPEWRVMAVLGRFGADTAKGLCERTAMDKVTVSRATTSLLSKQYLDRTSDPDDRRRTIFNLTPAGRGIHDQIVPLARTHEAELLAGLSSAERSQLDRILGKLMIRSG